MHKWGLWDSDEHLSPWGLVIQSTYYTRPTAVTTQNQTKTTAMYYFARCSTVCPVTSHTNAHAHSPESTSAYKSKHLCSHWISREHFCIWKIMQGQWLQKMSKEKIQLLKKHISSSILHADGVRRCNQYQSFHLLFLQRFVMKSGDESRVWYGMHSTTHAGETRWWQLTQANGNE